MLGAITGDVLGSSFEFYPMKTKKFELLETNSHFTDDTVMTVAVADSIMNGVPYVESLQKWGREYPRVGYGGWFKKWIHQDDPKPYNSFILSAGMRHVALSRSISSHLASISSRVLTNSMTINFKAVLVTKWSSRLSSSRRWR